jgi:heterodisulfide reductase subunit B
MRYAMFRCCVTNMSLREYEEAADAVLAGLGVPFRDVREFGCCGYPMKNVDFASSVFSSARNFALAAQRGLSLLTVCNCCYGTLKHARHMLNQDEELARQVAAELEKEGLAPANDVAINHLMEVLHGELGPEAVARRVTNSMQGLRVALHYGCHLLRPSNVVQFDNPWEPSICDDMVAVTGAESIKWETRLDCCGAPLGGVFDDVATTLAEKKLAAARQAGAHCLCVICPYCHLQLRRARQSLAARGEDPVPVIFYTRLLASAMGEGEDLSVLARAEA